jgi:hypothetical protein
MSGGPVDCRLGGALGLGPGRDPVGLWSVSLVGLRGSSDPAGLWSTGLVGLMRGGWRRGDPAVCVAVALQAYGMGLAGSTCCFLLNCAMEKPSTS